MLGACASTLGSPPVGEGPHQYVWVTEFPLFEGVDEDGAPMAAHHPFTMPHPEDLDLHRDRPAVGALAVPTTSCSTAGSWAAARSGSTAPTSSAGLSGARHLRRGGREPIRVPARRLPVRRAAHAGFAFGIDRLVAIFAGEENIREVIAFPKTQSGADLMTGAPTAIAPRCCANCASPSRRKDRE